MQRGSADVASRRVWLRGLLFSGFAGPLLGAATTLTLLIAGRLWLDGSLPPSTPKVILIGVSVAFIVATGPGVAAGLLCTFLAFRWRSAGLSRRRVTLRLGALGAALGIVAAVIAGSLADGEFVARPLYIGPGILTGLLIGLAFPRALWGRAEP